MAKIAIDARLWGIKDTGIGRYTENLVENLMAIDHRNSYVLLVRKADQGEITRRFPHASVVIVDVPIYSVREQTVLPLFLAKIKPDILHAPHFNIPVLWPGKMVVTIHDLITHEFRGSAQTTLPLPLYWFKYILHLFIFRVAVMRAKFILTPSEWVKKKITQVYSVKPNKIRVTPEAAGDIFFSPDSHPVDKLRGLIYSGNAYEHKNLERLIEAVKLAKIPLTIVSSRSVFRDRLEKKIRESGLEEQITVIGPLSDGELAKRYRESLAFITPSLSEGFGLSGLEAMAAGTIVLSSNSSCLPEVYGDVPFYFNPLNPKEIASAVKKATAISPGQRQARIAMGIHHARTFSWGKTAKLTLQAYAESCPSLRLG